MTKIRTYEELISFPSFLERYNYLRIKGTVGVSTYGFDRWINQRFYNSREWIKIRNAVILRDKACDLADESFPITDMILVHHMNPISAEDIDNWSNNVFDINFLITVSRNTHLAIHYGNESMLPKLFIDRRSGDTKLW